MKTFCLTTVIALMLLNSFGVLRAQNVKDKVCLDNTQQFSIASKYVAGENYIIQIGLPSGYSSSQKSYPVLYVTDGDVLFGMANEMTHEGWMRLGNDIKDIIVVGIGYGQGIDVLMKKRARDLAPSIDTVWPIGKPYAKFITGLGADNFLKFIQFELFPVVNKNYRINTDSVAIFGHSFGGLFAAYILFKQPELFKGYIISSPPLFWNNKSILKLEAEYFSNHKELDKIVLLDIGSLEDKIPYNEESINLINELSQNIQVHNYKGLRLVTRIFEGETHSSVTSTAISNGLRILFKP
jgi:predicted alpha/beta superfamily hydrolase